jgi:EAL domain-containing protein (putative c-di-GMP-specific phosphodiesterase class I)
MNALKAIGFKLSLDDFGTGFSSLEYLKTFPLDQIKIDQSFVINMFQNEKDIKIIKSILYLGDLLEMNVIAEGVEEKEHYEKLKELGCRQFQGYYFAKPQSISYINEHILKI